MRRSYTDLLNAEPPVTTVVLDTRSDQPDAGPQVELRWKNVRRDLAGAGVDAATLEAMDAAVADPPAHPGGESLLVVAAAGEVLVKTHLPDPPSRGVDHWQVGPTADLLPLLAADQSAVSHLVVLVDRIGADLYARSGPVGHHAPDRLSGEGTQQRSVEGDPDVQRSAPGGWSQRRFQQRAENTWETNAGDAAEDVVAFADEVDAELVIVGGDERAVGFLVDALPERLRTRVRRLESASRAEGAGIDAVADDVHRLVRTHTAERLTALLATFAEEKGQHDRAAEGAAAVVSALQTATVETLLVGSRSDDERRAWVGPEPIHLALTRDDLTAGMGVEAPEEAPLVDACIRAALGTGAEVVVVPASTVTDGVGAVLRHTGTAPAVPGRG